MRKITAKHNQPARALLAASALLGAAPSMAAAPTPVLKEAGSFFVNGEVIQTDNPGGGDHEWNGEEQCRKAVAAVKAAGGKAAFFATYEQGVRGNTHMMMMDVNNLQVADRILSWVNKNVGKKPLAASKR